MASKERERNVNVGRDLETLNKHVTVMSSRFILLSRHDLWLGPCNKATLTSHYRHWLKEEKIDIHHYYSSVLCYFKRYHLSSNRHRVTTKTQALDHWMWRRFLSSQFRAKSLWNKQDFIHNEREGIRELSDVHVTVHRDKFLIIKPSRCTNFSNLFLEWNSTCFGQFLSPSSGV